MRGSSPHLYRSPREVPSSSGTSSSDLLSPELVPPDCPSDSYCEQGENREAEEIRKEKKVSIWQEL